ncbi:MAG: DNA mismatch repair endonuclease MutL [Chloroflexi bacterium]|nr:DNA mismatch repair endonuclease MutL [Chloroflexota bacterium]
MPRPIQALDDLTIARIAAGEVVERPASVVKELVENAIDAGATDIRVELLAGGRRLIRVADDGHGIPASEVELAFRKHSTSKIVQASDLETVATLGFRGEALASIASVAHVTCLTRAAGETEGRRLRIDNGRVVDLAPAGAPQGCTISVENLFNAVPARLRFLKSDRTEAGHVHDVVARYALAHPAIRFRYRRDDRDVFRSEGSGQMADALAATLGRDLASSLIGIQGRREAEASIDAIEVRGFVSPPHLHRATRAHITLLVNGRWVQDSQLSWAVIQAYHSLLPKGRYPVAVILIELPASAVDVNVHPAKTEVRFRDRRPVFATLQRAVRAAVIDQAGVAPAELPLPGDRRGAAWRAREPHRPRFDPRRDAGPRSGADSASIGVATGSGRLPGYERPEVRAEVEPLGGKVGETAAVWRGERAGSAAAAQDPSPAAPNQSVPNAEPLTAGGGRLPFLRLIGQLAQSYLLAEGPDGLYLIDQHAAHERVMYEAFMARHTELPAQSLLSPEIVALTPRQIGLIDEESETFRRLGFDIEAFGEDSALVRALPRDLTGSSDVAATVRGILDATEAGEAPIDQAFEARLVRAVCKRATVKAGQTLSPAEQQRLVQDLEACASPWTCPHGRPTVTVIGADRIASLFGRN